MKEKKPAPACVGFMFSQVLAASSPLHTRADIRFYGVFSLCARKMTGFDRFFCTYAQEMSSFVEFLEKEEGEQPEPFPFLGAVEPTP